MFVDTRYDLQLIVPIEDEIYILMANRAGDSIIMSDNDMVYDSNSLINLDVIEDSFHRVRFVFYRDLNIISAKDGSRHTWHLASANELSADEIRIIVLEFEDTRNNRDWSF